MGYGSHPPPGDAWRFVYFVQSPSTGLIKIGTTGNVQQRLSSLCAETSENMVLLATLEGGFRLEKQLHGHFRDERRHGEWFEPGPELVAMVASIVAGKPVFGLPKGTRPTLPVVQRPMPPAPPLSHGAELLALAVKARGLSVNEAGKAIAAPIGLMSRLLTGRRRPSRRVAITIADAFGVPVSAWDAHATEAQA